MRIKKGNPVEVWTQEAGSPVGAWRGGEVTWGNGHSYTIRWHDGDGEVSGRISRKSVRPRPPPAPVPRDLGAGDMVEAFDDDDCLWKCAEVQGANAANDRHLDVKIVGAAKVLTVPPQRLRVRQMLRDDDVWVALHKDNHVAVQSAMPPHRAIVGMGVGRGKGGYKPMAPGFTPFLQKRSFGMLGSTSDTSSHGKRFEDDTKKRLKQEPRCGVQAPVPNVCVNNRQDEMSGEDCDDDAGIGINPDDDDDHRQQQHQQHERKDDKEEEEDDDDDSDSDSSSEDSSSGSDSDSRTRSIDAGKDCPATPTTRSCNVQEADQMLQPVKKEQPIIKVKEERQSVKKEQHCDDIAESREMKSEPLKDQIQMGATTVREHIHSLELEAYAALMKAFHACGDALSWEKEGLLSDLRVHLHISNDEHLQVLNVILNRKSRTRGPH